MSARDEISKRRAAAQAELAAIAELEAELDLLEGVDTGSGWPNAEEWASEDLGQFEWLVGGLITCGSISLLAALPGAGKSTLLTQLTISLTNGADFCGMHIGRPWKTMYVAAEGARLPFRNRYQQACRSMEMVHGSPYWLIQPRGFSDFRLDRGGVGRAVARHKPDLVVLDTLGYFGLDDENEAGEWKTKIMAPLKALASEHGTSFLMVHHLRKDGGDLASRVRGTSAMWGDVDHLLALDAPLGQNDAYRELVVLKSKYGPSHQVYPLSYDPHGAVFKPTVRAKKCSHAKGNAEDL